MKKTKIANNHEEFSFKWLLKTWQTQLPNNCTLMGATQVMDNTLPEIT